MTITTEKYFDALNRLPNTGQHILGYHKEGQIVVYQAYNHKIADYALENQSLGGDHFNYNRMSWIKPNFLWMMYRCGWASKENQERVLAIWINKADFEGILQQTVFSSFNATHHTSQDQWKNELKHKDVRLQWDPDHDPLGKKILRRAIQIGMKGNVLETFGKHQIKMVEDITSFVTDQKKHVEKGNLDQLRVPVETIFELSDQRLAKKIGVELIASETHLLSSGPTK